MNRRSSSHASLKAIVCGDVLNALAFAPRPTQGHPGATNIAVEGPREDPLRVALRETNFAALYKARKTSRRSRSTSFVRAPRRVDHLGGSPQAMTTGRRLRPPALPSGRGRRGQASS
jgi:hypothetical protein